LKAQLELTDITEIHVYNKTRVTGTEYALQQHYLMGTVKG